MSFFHLRWGLLLLSFVASCQSSSLDQKEMEVLEKVLSELYSPLFWNLMRDKRVSQPLCRLKEVSCVRVQGVWRVAEIVTKDSEVAAMGRIPEELGELRWLQVIDLTADPSAKASLRGPIPESLGQLLQLRKLILANNQLTGALPASLFQLRQLTVLNLAGNKLSGQLGEDIGSLTQLQVLSLENNRFSGPLATSFGRLLQLKALQVVHGSRQGTWHSAAPSPTGPGSSAPSRNKPRGLAGDKTCDSPAQEQLGGSGLAFRAFAAKSPFPRRCK